MTDHQFTIIECGCWICVTDAGKLGVPLPMRAEVTQGFAAMVAGDRAAIHAAVATARHPALRWQPASPGSLTVAVPPQVP